VARAVHLLEFMSKLFVFVLSSFVAIHASAQNSQITVEQRLLADRVLEIGNDPVKQKEALDNAEQRYSNLTGKVVQALRRYFDKHLTDTEKPQVNEIKRLIHDLNVAREILYSEKGFDLIKEREFSAEVYLEPAERTTENGLLIAKDYSRIDPLEIMMERNVAYFFRGAKTDSLIWEQAVFLTPALERAYRRESSEHLERFNNLILKYGESANARAAYKKKTGRDFEELQPTKFRGSSQAFRCSNLLF
jgi:hypothetical protein